MTDREMTTGEAEAWRQGWEAAREAAVEVCRKLEDRMTLPPAQDVNLWIAGGASEAARRIAALTPPETRARAAAEADYARGATPVAPEPPKGASGDPGASGGLEDDAWFVCECDKPCARPGFDPGCRARPAAEVLAPPPPAPDAADPIVAAVQADLSERSARGQAKYGATLARGDLSLSDWLQHAYEEALDLALYLRRAQSGLQAGEAAQATPVAPEAASGDPGASAGRAARQAEGDAWREADQALRDWEDAYPGMRYVAAWAIQKRAFRAMVTAMKSSIEARAPETCERSGWPMATPGAAPDGLMGRGA